MTSGQDDQFFVDYRAERGFVASRALPTKAQQK